MNWQAADVIALLRWQRHDFLNHFQVIGGYLQLNKNERALAYLKQSVARSEHTGKLMQLKHPALALISLIKMVKAATRGITLELEVHTMMMEHLLLEIDEVITLWAVAWDAALALTCTGSILKVSLTYQDKFYSLHFKIEPAPDTPREVAVLEDLARRSGVPFVYQVHKGEMSLHFAISENG